MNAFKFRSQVGADGLLHLNVNTELANTTADVLVAISRATSELQPVTEPMISEIDSELEKIESDPKYRDFDERAQVAHDKAIAYCKKGGRGDPLGSEPEWSWYWADRAAARFIRPHQWWQQEEALFRELWDLFGARQADEKKPVSRSRISHHLAELLHRHGEPGLACRWELHTHADEVLHGSISRRWGKLWLYGAFGISKASFDRLRKIAEERRAALGTSATPDWSAPDGFPEEAVRRFMFEDEQGKLAFSKALSRREFHLSRPYLQSLMYKAESGKDPGRRFEDVASYLCSLLPGCAPRRNLLDEERVSEYDLLVRNLLPEDSLTSQLFGRHFLVECKNWRKKSVGTAHVGYFLLRMAYTSTSFGVIFAHNGISGEGGAAQALIRQARSRDGTCCVPITVADLKSLIRNRAEFGDLLVAKIDEVRFGRPKRAPGAKRSLLPSGDTTRRRGSP